MTPAQEQLLKSIDARVAKIERHIRKEQASEHLLWPEEAEKIMQQLLLDKQPEGVKQAIEQIMSNQWNLVSPWVIQLYPNRIRFLLMQLGQWNEERENQIRELYEAAEASL